MSSIRRTFQLRQPVVVDIGCNCRKPRIFSFLSKSFSSKSKSPNSSSSTATSTAFTSSSNNSSSTIATTNTDSSWRCPPQLTTNSLYEEADQLQQLQQGEAASRAPRERGRRRRRRSGKSREKSRVRRESVAVAVESSEPYEDFKDSMVQMVVEKEIYAWDDLNDLLHQFLSLNSPRHHPLIMHAFADLWNRNGLFSPPSPCY